MKRGTRFRRPRPTRGVPAVLVLAAWVMAGPPSLPADEWSTVDAEMSSFKVHENTRLRNLDPVLQQLFLPDQDMDLKLTSMIQLFPVDPRLFDIPRAKGRARATFGCFSPTGQQNLGSARRKFNRNGGLAVSTMVPAELNCDLFFVRWDFLKRFALPAGTSVSVGTSVEVVDDGANADCFDRTTHCLNDDRFQVELDWRDFGGLGGPGIAFPRTDDSGLFFFFDPSNTELLVKVLDGCNFNGHFWVFAAAATDVEFTLNVTDTESGQTRIWENPLGGPAPAIVDTQAFATCP